MMDVAVDMVKCPCCGSPMPASDVKIDAESKTVIRRGMRVHLTPRQFAIFEHLWQRRGTYLSRTRLIEHLYQLENEPESDRVVEQFVCHMRKRLQPLAIHIPIAYGKGYTLQVLP